MLEAYLTAVATVCAISTALAVLIVLADATIADYGEKTITINDDRRIVVEGGTSLLTSLKSQDIFIPSACGGRGSCGLCTCRVTHGGGDVLPTELPWLGTAELERQVRLSCQLKVKRDLAIVIPEELFKVKQLEVEVSGLEDLTHDIKGVSLALPEPLDFVAGQFVQLEVPPYELTDESVYRAYSIASCPGECNCVHLEIKLVPEGICTTYVHRYLRIGDRLTLNGPYGDFFLRNSDAEILFIATGSGMAPIRAILQQMQRDDVRRKAGYFFGARFERDLFHLDEMAGFERSLHDFTFVPTVSRPEKDGTWRGEVGRVTSLCERLVEDPSNLEVYLCGAPGVIDSCVDVLQKKGVPADKCFFDKFS